MTQEELKKEMETFRCKQLKRNEAYWRMQGIKDKNSDEYKKAAAAFDKADEEETAARQRLGNAMYSFMEEADDNAEAGKIIFDTIEQVIKDNPS